MDKVSLSEKVSGPLSKKDIVMLAADPGISVSQLIELSLNAGHEPAFRASWILEHLVSGKPEKMSGYIGEFIDAYRSQQNPSCMRHYTKILMLLTGKRAAFPFTVSEQETLVEKTFEWLAGPRTPVAVKANCLDILFNLKDSYSWISDELAEQIIFLLKDGSAAMQSRGKKVLQKL